MLPAHKHVRKRDGREAVTAGGTGVGVGVASLTASLIYGGRGVLSPTKHDFACVQVSLDRTSDRLNVVGWPLSPNT